jgi:hypothetical protein
LQLNKPQLDGVPESYSEGHSFNQSKGQTMKQTRLMKILATSAVCALAITTATAQERTVTTTTTGPDGVTSVVSTKTLNGTGMISAYTPGSDYITFRGETDAAPVRYYYTKETPIVDVEGRTVAWSALRPDMPVDYTYVREGDRMIVKKVILLKPITYFEKTTTTTTTVEH